MGIFEELTERWIEEFGRAVEMFTGEKPVLTAGAPPSEISAALISNHTWWKQIAEGEGSFCIWAGATEPLWTALGEGAEGQTTFFEMLSQANQGMAAVLSAGFPVPLRCQDGVMQAPILPLDVEAVQVKVTFRGTEVGVIILVVEKSAISILGPDEPATVPAQNEPLAGTVTSPVMLSRLMDLQLPVSVLLGRATITVKDALKLISGSVIELDRQVGDYVDVMVHGTVVARGEIVSVKGNYGVRIKEVISRQDRIKLHEAA